MESNKIMFVTNSPSGGGAERSINVTCNELFSRNMNIHLIIINQGEEDTVIPSCRRTILGRKWQAGFIETIFYFIKFASLVRKCRPSVIVLNCDLPELFGAFLPFKQHILVLEHAPFPFGTRKHTGHIVRMLLRLRGAYWAAVSDHLRIWPTGLIPRAVLPNPLLKLKSARYGFNKVEELKRIVFVGRLSNPAKQPEMCLEIANRLNMPVLYVGDGIELEKLTAMAGELHTKAIFLGHIPDPWSYIVSGDLLIVPSRFEGDGLVVVEAIQRQIPFLLNDIADLRRFNLKEEMYCNSVDEFVNTCIKHKDNILSLKVDEEIGFKIVHERDVEKIGDLWVRLIKEISE